jgi:hypothetical protein
MGIRFVIEGEWSGYRSGQRRVVHREVYKSYRKGGGEFIETLRKIPSIGYTDGTSLSLNVREAKPREKVEQILGYRSLIRDAVYSGLTGYVSVAALQKLEDEKHSRLEL